MKTLSILPHAAIFSIIYLRDLSVVPLLIPEIDRLRSWRRGFLEAVTEDGREVAMSDILGYVVNAVRRGDGTIHPGCPASSLEGVVDDPFREDDEWDFVCSSM